MASWNDVRKIARALPETSEGTSYGWMAWKVKDKTFGWERPLGRADQEALGPNAPDGPILGVRVPDVGVAAALIADDPSVYFTIPHFDGFPAILVRLDEIAVAELTELLTEAWLLRAPKRLARKYLESST
ncbi:MAG TPA: MmcQ/YjbR family DNA-binding protein [Actinophytocola sp.]|uniref:MmcQ/YjbR family DNA-binding protein n=1 Tax=Actinophytocola sp. TaxID=1872138 RepID=UPI002DBECE4B|nr:MmcQ/YjbR family DNA-binding protein [Actinophytocola sp.]HEU5472890.1 MmcQ/YjbR family DNA-binding protein [Actinophytocola sp.]